MPEVIIIVVLPRKSGDPQGAIADYSKAIEINPQSANAYANRSIAKAEYSDRRGSCADTKKQYLLEINQQHNG